MKLLLSCALVLLATQARASSDCASLSDQGEKQLEQGHLAQAKPLLEAAVRVCRAPPQVRGARPYVALGSLYFREKRYSEAVHQFEDALTLQPGLPRAYINLSAVYSSMGDQEKAIEYGKKGLNSGVGDEAMQANFNVGLSYVRLAVQRQQYADRSGLPYFQKGSELKPSFGGNFFYLGVYKETDGDLTGARALYQKACKLDYADACDGASRVDSAKPRADAAPSMKVPYEATTGDEETLYQQIRAAYLKKGLSSAAADQAVTQIKTSYTQVKPEYRVPALQKILKGLQ